LTRKRRKADQQTLRTCRVLALAGVCVCEASASGGKYIARDEVGAQTCDQNDKD
jgi:hypothetical protein